MDSKQPIVLIGGFLAPCSENLTAFYWGEALNASTQQQTQQEKQHRVEGSRPLVIPIHPSPVASAYDRAREIFYALKGGLIDYGEEHSTQCGHNRFSDHEMDAKIEEWDANNPIHLVGHSFGGNTIRYLQNMLAKKQFQGYDTDASWIKSVTCINSPLNGCLTPYALGARIGDFDNPRVTFLSLGYLLTFLILFVEFLDIVWLREIYDTKMGHWDVSWKKHGILAGLKRIRSLMKSSDDAANTQGNLIWGDNAANDMTIIKAERDNKLFKDYNCTYYFSFAGGRGNSHHNHQGAALEHLVLPAECDFSEEHCGCKHLRLFGIPVRKLFLGAAKHSTSWAVEFARLVKFLLLSFIGVCLYLVNPQMKHEEHTHYFTQKGFSHGDGICSIASQTHPSVADAVTHVSTFNNSNRNSVNQTSKGQWYVYTQNKTDHFGTVGLPECKKKQLAFFTSLYGLLHQLE